MAESNEHFCKVCDAQHVTKKADHWCPECEEGLCTDCLKHHNASKYTRSHEVMSIENYSSLPPHVAEIVQHCEEHGKKYQLYCPQHDCLGCIDCFSPRHSQCSGVSGVDELVKNAKSYTLLSDIERGLRDVKSNIDRISEEKKQNLSRISSQRQQICDEIKSFRNKINLHLDTMENQLMNDLDSKEEKIKLKIENLLKELKQKQKSIQELQDSAKTINQYGTNVQAFFVSKSLTKSMETEEMYIQSLFEGSMLQQYDLELVMDELISAFVWSVKCLGKITCSESSTAVTYHTEKEKQAQIFSQPHKQLPKLNDEVNITLIQEFQMRSYPPQNRSITGCTVNTEGKIILADDNNKCLVVLNDEGKVESRISTEPSRPWDITCIDDCRVAVTCNYPNKILLVNIISETREKTIPRDNTCYGIQHRDGTLLYYESTIGIQTYNLTTSTTAVVVKAENESIFWKYPRFVAVSRNRIYLTQRENDLVLCYSDTGENLWEYSNQKLTGRPFGVAVDKYSNVYVASYDNKSVVVISSDGKNGRKLMKLRNPVYAIHIDNNDRLLVVDFTGNVTIYKI